MVEKYRRIIAVIHHRQMVIDERKDKVLRGKQKDPFDSYGWLNNLHEKYKLKPYYFFLLPEKRGRYDKNISPKCKSMQELIHDHVIRYPMGIHPSWKSGDDVSLLKKEIETLSKLNGNGSFLPVSIISGSICRKVTGD